MKFGLFGGAKSSGEGSVGDSLGYQKYIDYVLLRRGARLSQRVRGRAPLHGCRAAVGLAQLPELSRRPHQAHTSRHGGGGAALAQSGIARRAGCHARPSVQRPLRFRRRQGLSPAGVRGLLHSHRGGNRAVRRNLGVPAQGLDRRRSLLAPRDAAGTSRTSSSSRARSSSRILRCGWGRAASSRSGVRRRRGSTSCSTRSRRSI